MELVNARYKRANFESDQGHGVSLDPEGTEVLYKMLETTPSQLKRMWLRGRRTRASCQMNCPQEDSCW